ncbi:MAG: hypothetical protein H7Z74_17510 [Anaerolineae bacterium]|nr:hypothetical protein [Gemmatimonadaceae bacterium]
MLLPALFIVGSLFESATTASRLTPTTVPTTYSGLAGQIHVRVPRIDGDVKSDGRLDEPQWASAALLTGFSQFSPSDGRPAEDSTQASIWYSETALHIGIRAFEAHGSVHATLADRDRISADDYVEILLGTFNDGRQATVFGVNPLGVQSDGVLVESGQSGSGDFIGSARASADLSPDYVFQSSGRLTGYGYEVEIRIPFKSLRYQPKQEQQWGINIIRRVQHSGYEDSWAPAKRAAASFLGQAGTLDGLTDLRRGLVLDVNPVVTSKVSGAPAVAGWQYDADRPEAGANVRWGVTDNVTLNGTVNPDFSQVESDAGQVAFDPRQALFFSEKRPFFLDGIEQFNTPNSLIYTRRIQEPLGAVKLTGKVSGTDIAFLSAVDEDRTSFTGRDNPVFNILRVQRDVGSQSRVGIAYTDRIDGDNYNRVANADARIVFGKIYSTQLQIAGSTTRTADVKRDAPLWEASFNRNGRAFNMDYTIRGIHEDFRAQSGFVSRPGIVRTNITHNYTVFGERGALFENFTGGITLDGTWQYQRFVNNRDAQDKKLHFNTSVTLRGGWQARASLFVETFGYDPVLYADYALEVPSSTGAGLDTVAFTGTPRIRNTDYYLRVATPQFKQFSGSVFAVWGRDENFFEWSPADILYLTLVANWRPTDKLRLNAQYQHQQFDRRSDGSTVGVRKIPRLKLEYQIARPIFVRVIGEYDADMQDDLRDDSRTGAPILVFDPGAGGYVRALGSRRNNLRSEWLFSYQPSPGTVFFAGYGSTMNEPEPLRFGRLRRTVDGFFVKLSYLYRL